MGPSLSSLITSAAISIRGAVNARNTEGNHAIAETPNLKFRVFYLNGSGKLGVSAGHNWGLTPRFRHGH